MFNRAFFRLVLVTHVLVLCAGCEANERPYPWLNELGAHDLFPSGERLMALADGLHLLEQDRPATETEMLVAVHGWHSRGYEWVHLLKKLDQPDTSVWFYRWDDDGCPGPASRQLLEQLQANLTPDTAKIHLFGHSYGGLVLADMLDRWPLTIPVDVHIVASPLASATGASVRCGYEMPTAMADNVRLFEWRTQWQLDGAFKDMPEDPQIIELAGSHVTRLPDEYNGNRLGHNWSLSWVADHVAANRPGPGEEGDE